MLDPQREIQALVDNFVADLSDLAKRIAIAQIKTAFDAGGKVTAFGSGGKVASFAARTKAAAAPLPSSPSSAPARPGREPDPPSAGRRAASSSSSPSSPSSAPARPGRARRGQREIEALRTKLLATIAENPGRRAEDLNNALGTRTAQIAQPLRQLIVEQLVRTEGARRGMRYFVVTPPDVQNGRRMAPETSATADEQPPA